MTGLETLLFVLFGMVLAMVVLRQASIAKRLERTTNQAWQNNERLKRIEGLPHVLETLDERPTQPFVHR